MANDAEEAQKLQEDQLSTIEKLEMQKALLQVRILELFYKSHSVYVH